LGNRVEFNLQIVNKNQTQEKFRTLFENNLYGIVTLDEQLRFVDVNPSVCNFLGYTKTQLLKRSISDITHPEQLEKNLENYQRLIKGEVDHFEEETRYLKKSGETLFVSVAIKGIYDEKHQLIESFGTIQDISRRKLSEMRLMENEEKFRLISETARDLICLLDEKGKYIYVSPSVSEVLGFSPKELIGKSPYLLFHPSDVTRIMKESQEREQEKELRYTLEYRMKRKDGDYIWLQTVTEPIKNEEGNITKIQTSSRDITKMKNSEAQIKELLRETQRLNKSLEENSNKLKQSLEESITLNQDLENRERLKNFLISISIALSGMRNTDEVIGFILKELRPVVYFDGVGIMSINANEKSQTGFVFISEKIKRFEALSNKTFLFSESTLKQTVDAAEPTIINHVKANLDKSQDAFQEEVFHMGFKESMVVPIKHSGKVIGALYLCSCERGCYSEDQFDLLQGVSGQLGATMRNIIAFQDEERKRQYLEHEVSYLNEEIISNHNYREIVGETGVLQHIMSSVRQVANTETTVLINGETGTGKELIARGIHHFSNRNKHPLIKVNCAALPPQLIESELFGHEKGSFTGAISRRLGKFELAQGSSIFLDEIGELPMDLQAKLLRVIQEKEFERIGGQEVIKLDARIIAATNRNLELAVSKGKFRLDLYYRLNVFPINLPPLRERKEDIPLLVAHFLTKLKKKVGKDISKVSSNSLKKMLDYDWPGNIRELEHILERNAILAKSDIMEVELLSRNEQVGSLSTSLLELRPLMEVEANYIVTVLKHTNGRIRGEGGAAELLKVKPTTLEAKMKKLGIVKKHVMYEQDHN
jgi:formate hydrogenlyase transcriptional activator